MRMALVHYWLVKMRGGEKAREALCRPHPEADIYVNVFDPTGIFKEIKSPCPETAFVNLFQLARAPYKNLTQFIPIAIEQLNIRGYYLDICREFGHDERVIAPAKAQYLCYCHSPMHYIWNAFHDYRDGAGWFKRAIKRVGKSGSWPRYW